MGRFVLDTAAIAAIPREPSVDQPMHRLADTILAEAKSKAPVGDPEGGHLVNTGFVDGRHSEYTIGFDANYAAYVEMGTDDTKAQPYLAPAALRNRGTL